MTSVRWILSGVCMEAAGGLVLMLVRYPLPEYPWSLERGLELMLSR